MEKRLVWIDEEDPEGDDSNWEVSYWGPQDREEQEPSPYDGTLSEE
jgi:hypothetical protein